MKELRLRIYLAIVILVSLIMGTSYLLVQQEARLDANDQPRVLLATAKRALSNNIPLNEAVSLTVSDLRTSDIPFIIVTDDRHDISVSSVRLDGKSIAPPDGVFDEAAKTGRNELTWQPAKGVRLATVVEPYQVGNQKGFVITGQSLSQIEKRASGFLLISLAVWLITITGCWFVMFAPLSGSFGKTGLRRRKLTKR